MYASENDLTVVENHLNNKEYQMYASENNLTITYSHLHCNDSFKKIKYLILVRHFIFYCEGVSVLFRVPRSDILREIL